MNIIFIFLLFFSTGLYGQTAGEKALSSLQTGNLRFMKNELCGLNSLKQQREESLKKQSPKALVLGCSDSRVGPEIIFDQGIGELFVIRVAGQVLGETERETLRFGVTRFEIPLIVVLGHEQCGALSAFSEGITKEIPVIAALLESDKIKPKTHGKKDLSVFTKAHVQACVEKIKQDSIIKPLVEAEFVKIVGAFYHLESGRVEFL